MPSALRAICRGASRRRGMRALHRNGRGQAAPLLALEEHDAKGVRPSPAAHCAAQLVGSAHDVETGGWGAAALPSQALHTRVHAQVDAHAPSRDGDPAGLLRDPGHGIRRSSGNSSARIRLCTRCSHGAATARSPRRTVTIGTSACHGQGSSPSPGSAPQILGRRR